MAYKEVSIWWRIARFTSESGQFLQAEITHGTAPSSILSTYESCGNFLCWETEWESSPVVRTAAEASSINQLMSDRSHCAVAANERSESATGFLSLDLTKQQGLELLTGLWWRNSNAETSITPIGPNSQSLLGACPELVLFDDVVEETTQQEEAPPLFEPCTSIWHTAISSSRVQEAVNVQVSRIISKIDSKRSCSFDIDWSSSTGVPLLSVTDFSTGQAYYGQADNFCEIYKGISPEMLYFYSTADEEF